MSADLIGHFLTLAIVVVGFAVWSKSTVAVLSERVAQHAQEFDLVRADMKSMGSVRTELDRLAKDMEVLRARNHEIMSALTEIKIQLALLLRQAFPGEFVPGEKKQ